RGEVAQDFFPVYAQAPPSAWQVQGEGPRWTGAPWFRNSVAVRAAVGRVRAGRLRTWEREWLEDLFPAGPLYLEGILRQPSEEAIRLLFEEVFEQHLPRPFVAELRAVAAGVRERLPYSTDQDCADLICDLLERVLCKERERLSGLFRQLLPWKKDSVLTRL